jgi:hypothetical protein
VTTAKLPVELRAKTRRLISELAVGETGYVGLRSFIVTSDQDCFLDSKGTLETPGLLQMTVRRDEKGFHVVLPSAPEFSTEQVIKGMDVLPIASIVISREKWSPRLDERLAT